MKSPTTPVAAVATRTSPPPQAVGGALAGNQIQKNVTSDTYDISVRMDDGRTIVVNQRDLGGIRENTYVRVVNGKVILR